MSPSRRGRVPLLLAALVAVLLLAFGFSGVQAAPGGIKGKPSPSPSPTPCLSNCPTPGPTPTPTPTPTPSPTPSPTGPSATFTYPGAGVTAVSDKYSNTITWTENSGTSTITSRALTESYSLVSGSNCGTSWSTAWTTSVPANSFAVSGLNDGYCYRYHLVLTNAAGQSGSADSGNLRISYFQSTTIVFDSTITLSASVDYPNARASATETLNLTNQSGTGIDFLNFTVRPRYWGELASLSVSVNAVDMTGPARWTGDGSNLQVPLGFMLVSGGSATVSFSFALSIWSDVSTGQRAELSKSHGVMQLIYWYPSVSGGQGQYLAGDPWWSPVKSSRITYTVSSSNGSLGFATPGVITSTSSTSVSGYIPNARDFSFAVSPGFSTYTRSTSSGTSVVVYYNPSYVSASSVSSYIAADAVGAMNLFNSWMGKTYPLSRFVIFQSPMPSTSEEVTGGDSLGSSVMNNSYGSSTTAYITAHETSHQWFYWMVSSDEYQEPWLDEAFATWAGTWYQTGVTTSGRNSYCSSDPVVNSPITAFPNTSQESAGTGCGTYSQTVYYKGSWLIANVRSKMGSTDFWNAMHAYMAKFWGSTSFAHTADIVSDWKSYSGGTITDSWLKSGWLSY